MGRAGAGDVHAGSLPRRELNVHSRALPAAIFHPALAAFTPWNIARAQRYYESPTLWKSADLVRHLVNSNFLYWVRGQQKSRQVAAGESLILAGPTGLEPATSGVTGLRSNQLNYDPVLETSVTTLVQRAFHRGGRMVRVGVSGVNTSGVARREVVARRRLLAKAVATKRATRCRCRDHSR